MNTFKPLVLLKYCALTLGLIITIYKGILPGWKDQPADFYNYYVASKLVTEGEAIHQFYDNEWFAVQAQKMGIISGAKFAPFPPATAYIFIPLTSFNPLNAKRIWLIINCLLILLIGLKTKKYVNPTEVDALLLLALFTIPITNCLAFGQIYLLLAFIIITILMKPPKHAKVVIAGMLLGLMTLIKYIPLFFMAYFHQNKNKKKLALTVALTILLPSLLIYLIDNQSYISFFNTFSDHLKGDLSGQGKYAIGFQSLDSMLNNLFVLDEALNPSPFIEMPILKPILKGLIILSLGTVLFALFKKSSYQLNPILISIGIIGSFIIFPATASYHFLLLFLPILIISKWLITYKKTYTFFMLIALATFTIQYHHVPNLNAMPYLNLVIHYPRFWTLLCLFLFLAFHYSKLIKTVNG